MMRWIRFLPFLLVCQVHAFSLTAIQASATQELLYYTAPDTATCTVAISTVSTYTPLVHDVDPILFTNSNLDSRVGAIQNGTTRIFVVGTRIGQVGLDGVRYSRALETYRVHYATATCDGGVSSSTTFTTQTIPLGDTFVDPVRSDPTSAGTYQYPDLIDNDTGQIIIDPDNGVHLSRINLSTSTWGQGVNGNMTYGGTRFCSPIISSDTAGDFGYHCTFDGELVFINKDNGQITDLGGFVTAYNPVEDGWNGGIPCAQSVGGSWDTFNGNTCWVTYPTLDASLNETRNGVLRAIYNGQNTAYSGALPDCSMNGDVQPCIEWTNLTPGHNNGNGPQDLANMAINFDSRYSTFTALSSSGTFGIFAVTAGNLYMYQNSSIQNSLFWQAVFSPGDGNPLHAGLSTGPHIFAMTSSYLTSPLRFCGDHTSFTGDLYQSFSQAGCEPLSGTTTSGGHNVIPGLGPYIAFATSTLTSTPSSCPSQPGGNTLPNWPTGNNCGTISTDGDVRNQQYYLGPPAESEYLPAVPGDLFFSTGTNEGGIGEFFRLLIKNGPTNWTVQRGYGWSGFQVMGASTTLTFIPGVATTFDSNILLGLSGAFYWDVINDPHGNNIMANPISLAHQGEDLNYLYGAGNANGYQVYFGTIPVLFSAQFATITWNNSFAGVTGLGVPNSVDTHPSTIIIDSSSIKSFADGRAWVGGTFPNGTGTSATNPTGNIYEFANGVISLNRKQLPTTAFCGQYPLIDVSGPSSSITVSSNTYCVVNNNGECYSGSSTGQVYVNCASITYPYCYSPPIAQNGSGVRDICIGDTGPYPLEELTTELPGPNSTGSGIRTFGHAYQIFRWNDPYENPRPVVSSTTAGNSSDGSSWMFFSIPGGSYATTAQYGNRLGIILLEKIPPINTSDTLNRADFIPISLTVAASTFTVDNVVVQFGYAEYGPPTSFYCTSRHEACLATTNRAVSDSVPFKFAVTESSVGVSCASGCTVTLPLIPQRVAYYQVIYRNSANTTVALGPVEVAAENMYTAPIVNASESWNGTFKSTGNIIFQ